MLEPVAPGLLRAGADTDSPVSAPSTTDFAVRFESAAGGKAGKVTVYDEKTGRRIAEVPSFLSDFLGETCIWITSNYDSQHTR
jgi:hypothetical protein